jgi:hypothetical protein
MKFHVEEKEFELRWAPIRPPRNPKYYRENKILYSLKISIILLNQLFPLITSSSCDSFHCGEGHVPFPSHIRSDESMISTIDLELKKDI